MSMPRLPILIVVVLALGIPAAWLAYPALFGGSAGDSTQGSETSGKKGRIGQPVPVTVATVTRKDVPVTLDSVGTVQALASIALKPRIDSQVVEVHVAEGAVVKEGDLIFTLDDRSLRAQLAQVEAQIAKDRALVEQATRNRSRSEELSARGAATLVTRDDAVTSTKTAEAQLAADSAQKALLETQLSYTRIKAPVGGRIGSITAKPGTVVRASDTQNLAVVNQIDPIYISFSVPQSAIGSLRAAMAGGAVMVEAKTGEGALAHGRIAFTENAIDSTTGTLTVKAKMDNAEEILWPGAFVTARVFLGTEAGALTVPAVAVQPGQSESFVYIVRDDKTVTLVPVSVARKVEADAVVASGLSGGEKVIVQGASRVTAGGKVSIQDASSSVAK